MKTNNFRVKALLIILVIVSFFFLVHFPREKHIYIYDTITIKTTRYVSLELEKTFFDYFSENKKLIVHINTVGGSVMETLAIINILNSYASKEKIYINEGFAGSGGGYILASGPKGSRYSYKNSVMHLHKSQSDLVEKTTLLFFDYTLFNIIKKATNLSDVKVDAILQGENYMVPKTALKYGLIDKIIE